LKVDLVNILTRCFSSKPKARLNQVGPERCHAIGDGLLKKRSKSKKNKKEKAEKASQKATTERKKTSARMLWFRAAFADAARHNSSTASSPATVQSPTSVSGCPIDHSGSGSEAAAGCPVDHKSSSSREGTIPKECPMSEKGSSKSMDALARMAKLTQSPADTREAKREDKKQRQARPNPPKPPLLSLFASVFLSLSMNGVTVVQGLNRSNYMPADLKNLPSEGQKSPLSRNRASSTIPKGGYSLTHPRF
jgi:hypothetical protein